MQPKYQNSTHGWPRRATPTKGLRIFFFVVTLLTGIFLSSLLQRQANQGNTPSIPAISLTPISTSEARYLDESMETFADFADEDPLHYAGYTISTRYKQVKIEEFDELADVTYVVVKKGKQLIRKFDGLAGGYHSLGNDSDIGLFPFLGKHQKQLIVQQTQWRGCANFIVDFSPHYHVIYDDSRWGVGRELMYGDIDGDGVLEISQSAMSFMFFKNLSFYSSHAISIVFKYNEKSREYLPINHLYQTQSLAGIEDQIAELDRKDEHWFARGVFLVLLRYIYAGREDEGWRFFDREFPRNDKNEVKEEVKKILKDDKVYQFIYNRGSTGSLSRANTPNTHS